MWKILTKSVGVLGMAIQYGCIAHCTFEYLGDFVFCTGPSMEPTLYSNNILITERISTRMNNIQRGDIIIAKCPNNPTQHICKRVIALPGDKIITQPTINFNPLSNKSKKNTTLETLESNRNVDKKSSKYIYNNNKNDEEIEIEQGNNFKLLQKKEIVIPRGHIWIEGDNFENSSDSRFYGPIPQGLVRSRAILRIWPLSEIKILC